MMTIKSRILLVSAASLLTLSACNADENSKTATPPAAGNVAATVNGTAIGKDRVELLVKQRAGMGQADSPEMRKAIIDQLAMQMIVSQEAIKKGLDKS